MAKQASRDNSEIMGLREAAKEFGISYRRALGWVQRGQLRAQRIGDRSWAIRRGDLEEFRQWWQDKNYSRYQRQESARGTE